MKVLHFTAGSGSSARGLLTLPPVHTKDSKDMVAGEQVGLATCIIDRLSVTTMPAHIVADTNDVAWMCGSVRGRRFAMA